MMKKAKVIGVGTSPVKSSNGLTIVLTLEDESGTFLAIATKTLSPKCGDIVWVFQDKENLNYKGYSAVAVLIA